MKLQATKGKIRQSNAPFVQECIQDKVNREALVEWAQRETPEFKPIAPLPSQIWKNTPIRAFISQILP